MRPEPSFRPAEEILRAVAEGTAAATGDDFFRSLTRHLASALGLRYCFLTRCVASSPGRLATVAFWNGERFLENFEYDLAGTPCERVVAGETCVFGRDVQTLFPEDRDLVDLDAASYAAVPCQSAAGDVIGHLALLDVGTFAEDSLDVSVLKIFAARAGAELERQRTVAALEASERERRRYQKRLERRVKERTEELETFTYTVSHDLRSPLVTIGGFAKLLLKDYEDVLDAKGASYLSRIGRAAESMGLLIDSLLAYSRLGRGDMELAPVALSDVVAEAVEQLTAEIAESGVRLEVGRASLWVEGNRATLIQVLANLISNAVKYAGVGETPEVRVWAEAIDGKVRVYVRDNGIGIAPENYERIFRVFERLPGADDYPGTGLGLSIVRKGVERMGGRVGLESEVDVGSTFWIELRQADGVRPQAHHS